MSLSVTDFPALVWLTEQWETLRKEALALERSVLPLDREGASHFDVLTAMARIGRNGWTESWGINKKKWLTYGYRFMEVYAARYFNDSSHPETARLLSRLRGVKVCAVSLFLPDTCLPPHSHPELAQDGCLTYHLGLSVPEKYCYLYSDGEFLQHRTGQAFIFDGSKDHFAFNLSNEERYVFYIEFYRDRLMLV